MQKGITLIEILLVVAIVAVLGATTTPFLSKWILNINYDVANEKVLNVARKAQGYAMDGKRGEIWGVCKNGNVLRLFSVDCTSFGISEDYTIPSTISISGLGSVTFNHRGEASEDTVVQISSGLESNDISISTSGGIYD